MVTLVKLFSKLDITNRQENKRKQNKNKKKLQNRTIILTLTNELNKEV